jgi:hypothetical protein
LKHRGLTVPPTSQYNEKTRLTPRGQVAQVVERSPEKAGVGGSSPSLATISLFGMPAK